MSKLPVCKIPGKTTSAFLLAQRVMRVLRTSGHGSRAVEFRARINFDLIRSRPTEWLPPDVFQGVMAEARRYVEIVPE